MVAGPRVDFLLVSDPRDERQVLRIEQRLRAAAVELAKLSPLRSGPNLEDAVRDDVDRAGAVGLVIGPAGLTSPLVIVASVAERASPRRPVFMLLLSGADRGLIASLPLPAGRLIDLQADADYEDNLNRLAPVLLEARTGGWPEAEQTGSDSATGFDKATVVTPEPNIGGGDGPAEADADNRPETIFAALADSAIEAFREADGMRRAAGSQEIHMEHLLAGLYAESPGPARAAMEGRVTEADFRQILVDASGSRLPELNTYELATLDAIPPSSPHVLSALREARNVAGSTNSGSIESRHLFYGAMSVENCDPIQQLLWRNVSKDAALAWAPPAEPAVQATGPLTVEAAAKTDQPTEIDLLGYKRLVDALASLLMGGQTTFPLTIAISAPWGGGKSSVMRQLMGRLSDKANKDPWVIVQFPAWAYETGDQLWAAMAKQTYEAALIAQGGWIAKQRFRIKLEWRRRNIGMELVRVLLVLGGAIAGAILGFLFAEWTGLAAEGGVAAVGGVGGLIGVARAMSGDLADPFKRAVESFTQRVGVQRGDGFTPDAATSVNALMDAMLEKGGRLAIFIDDLDRCTPRNLVRVIEASNQIFVAGSDIASRPEKASRGAGGQDRETEPRRLAFIMGMDRQVVARGIETEYSALMARLEKANDPAAKNYGLSFLDKIIQLWVTLPAPERPALETLLKNVAGLESAGSEAGVGAGRTSSPGAAGGSQAPGETGGARDPSAGPGAPGTAADSGAAPAAETVAPSIDDDPKVWQAMVIGAACLEANPRQIKRFNNAFRLQLHLVEAARKSLTIEELAALSKWIAIRLRWGALAHAMDEEPDLLWALEQAANKVRLRGSKLVRADRQMERTPEWFDPETFTDQAHLFDALKVQRPGTRISELPFSDFLRVA